MSPIRIVAWALPVTLLLTLITAWTGGSDGPEPARPAGGETSDDTFPRTVTLPDGGALTLPRAPRRVFVANTAILDAVTALGASDRIVALPRQAATWSALARAEDPLPDVPRFGAFVAETVLAHEPDLVLCSVHSLPETVVTLDELGVPVVRFGFPRGLDDVRAQLRVVAELLGAEVQLAELERNLDRRVTVLREGLTAMFYTHDGSEGWTSGPGTVTDDVLGLAGLRNVVRSPGPVRVTIEETFALDPDVLIVPRAVGEVDAATDRAIADPTGLGLLRAVRTGNVVRLHPSLFSTTSHEAITAAEVLARAVATLPGDDR